MGLRSARLVELGALHNKAQQFKALFCMVTLVVPAVMAGKATVKLTANKVALVIFLEAVADMPEAAVVVAVA